MKKNLIDLSCPISESGSRYPSDPAPRITVFPACIEAGRLKSAYTELAICSHHGTHIDAPAHKIPGGKTIDQYELSKFINRAVLIDFTRHLEPGEDYARRISQDLLEQVFTSERLHCMQREGISALLFRTGYDKVIERGVTDDINFPYFEEAAAVFLVKACGQHSVPLNLVGLDSFSVDPKGTPDSPAHYAFLSRDTLILETLVHLEEVARSFGEEAFELICPPILYRGADAAQVRAFTRALGPQVGK
jgi:kynurenine formamidase